MKAHVYRIVIVGIFLLFNLKTSAKPGLDTRVLFIGDSFTGIDGGIGSRVAAIAAFDPEIGQILVGQVVAGGSPLKKLWETGDAVRAIDSDKYSIVVIQDDIPEINVDYFRQYAQLFVKEARKHHARPVLYMTWAYKRLEWISIAGIAAAHRSLAHDLGVEVAPVGVAWEKVQQRRPELDLFRPDREHPNNIGVYLAACTLYGTLFHRDPSNSLYVSPTLDSSDARFIRQVAWETINSQW
jgi:hypothetical protein